MGKPRVDIFSSNRWLVDIFMYFRIGLGACVSNFARALVEHRIGYFMGKFSFTL